MMENQPGPLLKRFNFENVNNVFLGILIASIILGGVTGYLLSQGTGKATSNGATASNGKPPKSAQQDTRTFRDFASGMIQKRPVPKDSGEYVEGTHLLVRENAAQVALTSSVVDLSQYEGKKVKVFGESQKAIKEGWLMDVGKVEVE